MANLHGTPSFQPVRKHFSPPAIHRRLAKDRGADGPATERASFKSFRRHVLLAASTLYIVGYVLENHRNLLLSSANLLARGLSVDLGGGLCRHEAPLANVPDWLDLHKTLIVGYPGGGKRLVFLQMEALTGLPAKDAWDFKIDSLRDRPATNHPFIKSNYPHHEGIWDTHRANQTILVHRKIRTALVEYHDIMFDFSYPESMEEGIANREMNVFSLYTESPNEDAFLEWRDAQLLNECAWYAWYIDFWMENGVYRDIFTHQHVTRDRWLSQTERRDETDDDYGILEPEEEVLKPIQDLHCTNGDVAEQCAPKTIISTEKLYDADVGVLETFKIGYALLNSDKMADWVLHNRTWHCIWEEVVEKKKGGITVFDRPESPEWDTSRRFEKEMLEKMIYELDYLIAKYSNVYWGDNPNAQRLVELVVEDRNEIQADLDERYWSRRRLSDKDFLGPVERARRKAEKLAADAAAGRDPAGDEEPDFARLYQEIEKQFLPHMEEKRKRLLEA